MTLNPFHVSAQYMTRVTTGWELENFYFHFLLPRSKGEAAASLEDNNNNYKL